MFVRAYNLKKNSVLKTCRISLAERDMIEIKLLRCTGDYHNQDSSSKASLPLGAQRPERLVCCGDPYSSCSPGMLHFSLTTLSGNASPHYYLESSSLYIFPYT